MTFPSAVVTTSERCTASQRPSGIRSSRSTESTVTQTCFHYRFFGIRTREEMQQLVGRGSAR